MSDEFAALPPLDQPGVYPIPPGMIASVVTCLEMTEPPPARPAPARPDLLLMRIECPTVGDYRRLYRAIGTPWLWYSRLRLDDAALAAVIHDPRVEVCFVQAADVDDRPIGLLELDRRRDGEVELAFFGLVPEQVGGGAGRWLMNHALVRAWREPRPRRVWVHTCNLDHPAALGFYIRSGFRPYRYAIDVDRDPRLAGLLPNDAAPGVPIIG